ncbi:MAG: HAMP domain-containing histidine kinase [Acidimicrobiales bacterium]|nr:HAMP domain-containing histidine kinase [Acidimicrobiales bacterium]MBO0885997.1 HAMP domain-containing histidine kinase [Acidimicrobiales bacterium]
MRRLRLTRRLATGPAVRRHALRVALVATLLVAVVYVLACLTINLIVGNRFRHDLDARLAERLSALVRAAPNHHLALPGVSSSLEPARPAGSGGDLDDAPVLAWWVPSGGASAVALSSGAPALPPSHYGVVGPAEASFGGRTFRLLGSEAAGGRVVVATSTAALSQRVGTLIVTEAALAPVALAGFFVAALIIGRGAAAPVEEARQRQLRFAADASHELRTPLSVIDAEVGVALTSDGDAESYRAALERIAGESGRLRSIVDDLLWLARVDTEPGGPRKDLVDLTTVVEGCAKRFGALATRRQVALSVEGVTDGPALVLAPAEWLDRLTSVLLDNACRYTGPGGQVLASVAHVDGHVALTVDDSGPGIPAEERDRIFERFHRATGAPGGAGLGLAIADSVVRGTAGRWEVSQAPTGGARMRVEWPRALAEGG